MNKNDFTKWREVKAYLDCLMKSNIVTGKIIFEYEDYTDLLYAKNSLNYVAKEWKYPIYFNIVDRELYFCRRDI